MSRAARQPKAPPTEEDVPADIAAERALLGACLIGGRPTVERAARIVAPEDFHDRRNRAIFSAMLSLLRRGSEIDPVTLGATLREGA